MTVVAGVAALLTGLAYTILGVLAAYEQLRDAGRRGWSHIGGASMLMAATCGPHHLVHAVHILLEGDRVDPALLAALVIGVVPGTAFVALRFEAIAGGRGDRFVAGSPVWLGVLPWLVVLAAGAVILAAASRAARHGLHPEAAVPNAILLVAYVAAGALILRTQWLRRPSRGGWSVSGLTLGAVFPTCGLSHAVAGLTAPRFPHAAVRSPGCAGVAVLPVGRAPRPRAGARGLEPPPTRGPARRDQPPLPVG